MSRYFYGGFSIDRRDYYSSVKAKIGLSHHTHLCDAATRLFTHYHHDHKHNQCNRDDDERIAACEGPQSRNEKGRKKKQARRLRVFIFVECYLGDSGCKAGRRI